jgi:transposase-like protein
MDPKTLIEAVRHFADEQTCFEYLVALKWPDGKITCPKCECDRIGKITSRRMLQCKGCRKQFSAKVGTIFEDSPLPLSSWFVAVWSIANAKNGISSCELGRALGVTQKSAWFMLHRVRLAMKTRTFRKLSGTVESDETFIGGKSENMHAAKREKRIKGRGAVGKAIVHGLLERGDDSKPSQVKANVIPNTERDTLLPMIARNVATGSDVFTDALPSYSGLAARYVHQFIDHATRYVAGKVHTNGIENFWSLVKRMVRGTYVSVAPFHLQAYLDEEVFRFNERKDNDGGRFRTVMAGVIGRRITYSRLVMADGEGFFDPMEG